MSINKKVLLLCNSQNPPLYESVLRGYFGLNSEYLFPPTSESKFNSFPNYDLVVVVTTDVPEDPRTFIEAIKKAKRVNKKLVVIILSGDPKEKVERILKMELGVDYDEFFPLAQEPERQTEFFQTFSKS